MGWSESRYDFVNVCRGVFEEGKMVSGSTNRPDWDMFWSRVRLWLYHKEGSRLGRFPKERVKDDCMITARGPERGGGVCLPQFWGDW